MEGYLLYQSHVSNARAEAERFAQRLPWLTSGQHEELVRLYAAERMALSRRLLRATADRCAELRAEYTERYQQLRRRVWCAALAVVLGVAAVAVGATLAVTSG